MDGAVVAGIGNIYANEALFHSGLQPSRAAGRLSRGQAGALVTAVRSVLEAAIAAGGTTLADGGYVDADGRPGWFKIQVAVYGRDGEPCTRCSGTVRRHILSGRSIFYCPDCQI